MIKVPREYQCMMYKDCEENTDFEVFLLTKTALVSEYDDNSLLVQIKRGSKGLQSLQKLANSEDNHSDEGFTTLIINKRYLPQIIESGGKFKSRPHLKGSWLEEMKEFYACELIPTKLSQIGYYEKELV